MSARDWRGREEQRNREGWWAGRTEREREGEGRWGRGWWGECGREGQPLTTAGHPSERTASGLTPLAWSLLTFSRSPSRSQAAQDTVRGGGTRERKRERERECVCGRGAEAKKNAESGKHERIREVERGRNSKEEGQEHSLTANKLILCLSHDGAVCGTADAERKTIPLFGSFADQSSRTSNDNGPTERRFDIEGHMIHRTLRNTIEHSME